MLDFATLQRPSSPNTCLVAPEGLCRSAQPDWAARRLAATPSAAFDAIRAAVQAEPRVRITVEDREAGRLAFEQRSRLMGFVDDVDVQVLADPAGAAVAIYSRSRVGYSDMGVNRKRVSRLLAAVERSLRG
jgi:uncharacterized protein (DUF1499 family)